MTRFFLILLTLLRDSRRILRRPQQFPRRQLLASMWRLQLAAAANPNGGARGARETRVVGMKVNFFDYSSLALLFHEIFIHKEYPLSNGNGAAPFIVDCGSNIGLAVLYFKKVAPHAKVLAFEPDPDTCRLLQQNIESNGIAGVQVVNSALAGHTGTVALYRDTSRPGAPYMSTQESHVALHTPGTSVAKSEIPAVKLSSYISQPVDFLKMDIEGAESDVLQDLGREGKLRMIRQMVMEFHHHGDRSAELAECLRLLESNGFGYQLSSELPRPIRSSAYQNILIYAYQKSAAGI